MIGITYIVSHAHFKNTVVIFYNTTAYHNFVNKLSNSQNVVSSKKNPYDGDIIVGLFFVQDNYNTEMYLAPINVS